MKKITRKPRTKAEYVKYHKILWNEIIRLLKKGKYDTGFGIKRYAFNNKFLCNIVACCFGCEWVKRKHSQGGCRKCFFKVVTPCLDEIWDKFDNKPRIVLAKKIRDFPVK